MRLQGKTAIVTGGSRGIGRACVVQLAAEGATVAFIYNANQAAADALAADLTAQGRQVQALQADVRDAAGRNKSPRAYSPSGSGSTSWSIPRASSRMGSPAA